MARPARAADPLATRSSGGGGSPSPAPSLYTAAVAAAVHPRTSNHHARHMDRDGDLQQARAAAAEQQRDEIAVRAHPVARGVAACLAGQGKVRCWPVRAAGERCCRGPGGAARQAHNLAPAITRPALHRLCRRPAVSAPPPHLTTMLQLAKVRAATRAKRAAPSRIPVFCTAQGSASIPAPTAVVTRFATCSQCGWQGRRRVGRLDAACTAAMAGSVYRRRRALQAPSAAGVCTHSASQAAFPGRVAARHGLLLS